MSSQSNQRGSQFEAEVAAVFELLSLRHPKEATVMAQPHLLLYNNERAVPDFQLRLDLPFSRLHYLIECQDRQRNSLEIARKIKVIKMQSQNNMFVFVYREMISPNTKVSLESDGVVVMSLIEFKAFIARVDHCLLVLSGKEEKPSLIRVLDRYGATEAISWEGKGVDRRPIMRCLPDPPGFPTLLAC